MTTHDRIDAVFKKCGWVCKGEIFRYRKTGRLVPFDRVMRAMPKDILEDVAAAWGEHKLGQELPRPRSTVESKPCVIASARC